MAKSIRWEHKRIIFANNDPSIVTRLNEYGDDRWELVSNTAIGQYNDTTVYTFKRDKDWRDKEDVGQDE
jgi:hypothetical protein